MPECIICKSKFAGWADKKYCSVRCKSYYHRRLRSVTDLATVKIDRILHRNRSILLEIMGKHSYQKKIPSILLDQKKFNYNYITKYTVNSKGKTYHHVYDFAWMRFSNDEIFIVRKSSN